MFFEWILVFSFVCKDENGFKDNPLHCVCVCVLSSFSLALCVFISARFSVFFFLFPLLFFCFWIPFSPRLFFFFFFFLWFSGPIARALKTRAKLGTLAFSPVSSPRLPLLFFLCVLGFPSLFLQWFSVQFLGFALFFLVFGSFFFQSPPLFPGLSLAFIKPEKVWCPCLHKWWALWKRWRREIVGIVAMICWIFPCWTGLWQTDDEQ